MNHLIGVRLAFVSDWVKIHVKSTLQAILFRFIIQISADGFSV